MSKEHEESKPRSDMLYMHIKNVSKVILRRIYEKIVKLRRKESR